MSLSLFDYGNCPPAKRKGEIEGVRSNMEHSRGRLRARERHGSLGGGSEPRWKEVLERTSKTDRMTGCNLERVQGILLAIPTAKAVIKMDEWTICNINLIVT